MSALIASTIAVTFDNAAPERRSALSTQLGYSVIEDEGKLVAGNGNTYFFVVSRIFDKRKGTTGARVEWDVELLTAQGRRLAANTLKAERSVILSYFKARIEADNAAKDAAGTLPPLTSQARAISRIAKAEQEASDLDQVYLTDRQGLIQAGELEDQLIGLWVERNHVGDGEETIPLTSQRLHIIWANNTQRHPSPRAVLKALKAGELVETQSSEYLLLPDYTLPQPPKDISGVQLGTVDRRNASLASYAASRNTISTQRPALFAKPTDEDQELACEGLEVIDETAEPALNKIVYAPKIVPLTWELCQDISKRNGLVSPHKVLKTLKDGGVIYSSFRRYYLAATISDLGSTTRSAFQDAGDALAQAHRTAQEALQRLQQAQATYAALHTPKPSQDAPAAPVQHSCA